MCAIRVHKSLSSAREKIPCYQHTPVVLTDASLEIHLCTWHLLHNKHHTVYIQYLPKTTYTIVCFFCFWLFYDPFSIESYCSFTHIRQGGFTGAKAVVLLPSTCKVILKDMAKLTSTKLKNWSLPSELMPVHGVLCWYIHHYIPIGQPDTYSIIIHGIFYRLYVTFVGFYSLLSYFIMRCWFRAPLTYLWWSTFNFLINMIYHAT